MWFCDAAFQLASTHAHVPTCVGTASQGTGWVHALRCPAGPSGLGTLRSVLPCGCWGSVRVDLGNLPAYLRSYLLSPLSLSLWGFLCLAAWCKGAGMSASRCSLPASSCAEVWWGGPWRLRGKTAPLASLPQPSSPSFLGAPDCCPWGSHVPKPGRECSPCRPRCWPWGSFL